MPARPPVIEIRTSDQRGRTELGWLHSRHSFSFGRYYDPRNMGYRVLRVLNDDVVEPGGGFGRHGHDNMEILTWVLEGALQHTGSTGAGGIIRPGDLQVMTAGRGIEHSEMNASSSESVHFLQMWIEPDARDLDPTYTHKSFPAEQRRSRWQVIASPDGREGSLPIHQDAVVQVAELGPGQRIEAALAGGRHAYLHVAYGAVRVGDVSLETGDAATIEGGPAVDVEASTGSQVLMFDLG